jgi:hypothetical protein
MPIEYTPRFSHKYNRLSTAMRLKVDKALRLLNVDFRHPGLRSHPIKDITGIYEAYIDEKYRMTFERHHNILVMRNIDNHDECLKNP